MKRAAEQGMKPAGNRRSKIRESRFPVSTFWIILTALLLMAGVHQGILIGMDRAGWLPIVQVHIIIFFWLGVSLALTAFVQTRMKQVYDKPLREISAATKKVAKGDFSVRVTPQHPAEKADYLDLMVEDLNTMIAELGSIETLKTDFISNVSHEMKTPLSVIRNSAELLTAETVTEERRRECAETIVEAAARMSDMITNILRLNRLEHQSILPEAKEYDLCRQLCDCLIQFEDRWEGKGVEMEVDLEDQRIIRADADLLELVWNNLLSNAVKFTEPGGAVSVRQRTEGDRVKVSVSDTGCGMSAAVRERIFEKFYQGDTSHATEGNGLGLALVARILLLMKGTVEVSSEAGKGSCFTVTLPVEG